MTQARHGRRKNWFESICYGAPKLHLPYTHVTCGQREELQMCRDALGRLGISMDLGEADLGAGELVVNSDVALQTMEVLARRRRPLHGAQVVVTPEREICDVFFSFRWHKPSWFHVRCSARGARHARAGPGRAVYTALT